MYSTFDYSYERSNLGGGSRKYHDILDRKKKIGQEEMINDCTNELFKFSFIYMPDTKQPIDIFCF